MRRIYRYISPIFLAAIFVAAGGSSGCTGEVRIRDEYHGDWHRWNHDEDFSYRQYLEERHEEYREYSRLNSDEQKDYWKWRHGRPENDRR